jgi:hypothetical protein
MFPLNVGRAHHPGSFPTMVHNTGRTVAINSDGLALRTRMAKTFGKLFDCCCIQYLVFHYLGSELTIFQREVHLVYTEALYNGRYRVASLLTVSSTPILPHSHPRSDEHNMHT